MDIDTKEMIDGQYILILEDNVLGSNTYRFTEENVSVLRKPLITLKAIKGIDSSITYRKLNDWDKKKIISSSRKTKNGWRRFSFIDIVKLKIVADLRKIGIGSERIRKILSNINNIGTCRDWGDTRFLIFEFFISSALMGNSIRLFITDHDSVFLYDPEAFPIFIQIFGSDFSYIALPFSKYVWEIQQPAKHQEGFYSKLMNSVASEKERQVLEIIRNKDFKEVTIKRKNNDNFHITAKMIENREFSKRDLLEAIEKKDYQAVTITRENGENVAIKREESYLV